MKRLKNILLNDRVYRDRRNAFDLPDDVFIRMFRLNKILVRDLIDELRDDFPRGNRRTILPIEIRVLASLRFFASGSYQQLVGSDATLAISQKSISRSIRSVSLTMNKVLLRKWIKFPSTAEEQTKIKADFMKKSAFPGIIGAIDCTHVAIIAPPQQDITYKENLYFNRKGYHSINTQIICDANCKILSISAKFPGSTHDSFIWKTSAVRDFIIKNMMEVHG